MNRSTILTAILELCGIELPNASATDGQSFAGVLRDDSTTFAAKRFWQWNRGRPNYTHNAAVRQGRFKLVRPFVSRGIRSTDSDLPPVLYDLSADPGETTDASDKYPDVARRLERSLNEWSRSVEADRVRPLADELK